MEHPDTYQKVIAGKADIPTPIAMIAAPELLSLLEQIAHWHCWEIRTATNHRNWHPGFGRRCFVPWCPNNSLLFTGLNHDRQSLPNDMVATPIGTENGLETKKPKYAI
jgi:hypothetical protein